MTKDNNGSGNQLNDLVEQARQQRWYGRRDVLKMGAAGVAAVTLTNWGNNARAAVGGNLQIMAWEGYFLENETTEWRKKNDVTFSKTLMTNQEDLTAKLAGNNPAQLDLGYYSNGYGKIYEELGVITKLDPARIPNYRKEDLFSPFYDGDLWAWDGAVWAIPYLWGYDSIIVNRELADVAVKSYKDLLRPEFKGKLAFQDQPLSTWPQIAKVAGYGDKFPFLTKEELADAFEKVKPYRDQTVVFSTSNGETLSLFTSGEIAACFASWCAIPQEAAKQGHSKLEVVLPEEGAAVWADAWFIPKTAVNIDTAYAFINEALSPPVQASIADFGYASPVSKKSIPLLTPKIKALFDFEHFDDAFKNIKIPGQPLRTDDPKFATFDDWMEKWTEFRSGS